MKNNSRYSICFWSKSASTTSNYNYREGTSAFWQKKKKKVERKYYVSILSPSANHLILSWNTTRQAGLSNLLLNTSLELLTLQRSVTINVFSLRLWESFLLTTITHQGTFHRKRRHFQKSTADRSNCFSLFHINLLKPIYIC